MLQESTQREKRGGFKVMSKKEPRFTGQEKMKYQKERRTETEVREYDCSITASKEEAISKVRSNLYVSNAIEGTNKVKTEI